MAATNQAPARAAAPLSRLATVKRGVLKLPQRYWIYGGEGTGKSTLAADAPDPIFIDAEGGSAALDVVRYPFYVDAKGELLPDGHVPKTYEDVKAAVRDLLIAPHGYRTLVIDTADKLEGLLWQWMIQRDNDPSVMKRDNPIHQIEDYGYGKGYGRAVDVWRELLVALDRLRAERGMEIVFLAHARVMNFKNPEGPDYDRWVPATDHRASGLIKGWCDVVGRLCHEETTKKVEGTKRHRGVATGDRILRLAHSAAFDAKARGNLPEEIDIPVESPWSALAAAMEAGREDDVGKIKKAIRDELARIGDAELTAKANEAVDKAAKKEDTRTMISYLNNLKTRPVKGEETDR